MNELVSYYETLAATYDENRFNNTYGQFIDKQERKILDKLLRNNQGQEQILDLACGSGRLLAYATHGVDASPAMIEIAQQKFKHKKLSVSDAAHTGLEENSIDAIISFHFFMHLNQSSIDAILTECSRVLKSDGRIIFDIPSKKRRKLLNIHPRGWHGAFSASFAELSQHPNFTLQQRAGILFLPIHRFPPVIRKLLIPLDSFLANSFLKEYSSYLVVELKKKN
jgi:ubiquinone/menaquinone biosynthesis C-methylase UbiE